MLFNRSIENYKDFSDLFGTTERRYNKVLYAFWKYRFKIDGDSRATQIKSLNELFQLVIDSIHTNNRILYTHFRNHFTFIKTSQSFDVYFKTDVYGSVGVPYNQDSDYIHVTIYTNGKRHETDIKAAKYFRNILLEHKVRLPESVINWCCEEFKSRWKSYVDSIIKGLTLHVDKRFDLIYDSDKQLGNFGSCMNNKEQYLFYNLYVNASAAYLTNEDEKIVARCIIFHDVTDIHGNVYNYAERQYSSDCDDNLKRILVNKLIAENYIDIYKVVGAGCRQVTAINTNQHTPLTDPRLKIKCNVQVGQTTSFMDTFISYDITEGVCYNYEHSHTHDLGHTYSTLR